jgi:hypothetical protein
MPPSLTRQSREAAKLVTFQTGNNHRKSPIAGFRKSFSFWLKQIFGGPMLITWVSGLRRTIAASRRLPAGIRRRIVANEVRAVSAEGA